MYIKTRLRKNMERWKKFSLFVIALLLIAAKPVSAQPSVWNVKPNYGPPRTQITLYGTDLHLDPAIKVCGADAGTVAVHAPNKVSFRAPQHVLGIGRWCDIEVTTTDGSTTIQDGFTYYEPPPMEMANRDFLMGFVPVLLGPSTDPVRISWYWNDARDIATQYGDIVCVLNHVWDSCDGGVPQKSDLSSAIYHVRWMHEKRTKVLLGLEITTGVRNQVGHCPEDTFADVDIWDDMESQVRFLFESEGPGPGEINYPDYLMLGIEMNMYYIVKPWDWENYKALLSHLYDIVREYTDNTKIVVSFQYEVLTVRGYLPWDQNYPRQWEIYGDLAVDVLGVSAYQGLSRFLCNLDPYELSDDRWELFTDPAYNPRGLPFAITETGYPATHTDGLLHWFCGSEQHQNSYLIRLAELLQKDDAEFMIWWSLHEGADENLAEMFTSQRLVTRDRACYPTCLPEDPNCFAWCGLAPTGTFAFDTWKRIFSLTPSK
jgi:hypothetical protein